MQLIEKKNLWAVILFMFRVMGKYLEMLPFSNVEDESKLGAWYKIKTSNFMIFQSDIESVQGHG